VTAASTRRNIMSIIQHHQRPSGEGPRVARRRGRAALAGGVALAALAVSSVSAAGAGQSDLAEVRAATAKFHRVEVAEQAGHQLGWKAPFLITGCIAHPTDGAMGYHWFNHAAIEDIALDPLQPEALVYEALPNGKLHLVAVEWIVPADAWHAAGNEGPPSVLGQELGILNPALGWYILHAWLWKPNPSGMFNNWNPDVDCP
jgi:hypothetical protein